MFDRKRSWITLLCIGGLAAASLPRGTAATPARTIVFISDLHIGLGKDREGAWYPTEDFRWPASLEGFLDHVSRSGGEAVDLVIVGDFLELWQPPPDVTCTGPNDDFGCSVEELERIVEVVLRAHRRELSALAAFARKGSNCVHVIPGNHDAALVLDEIWSSVASALDADRSCIKRAKTGVWVSEDGRVVAEHGHQIGSDPNRYGSWPKITQEIDGATYLRRPWGERFVQQVFNEEEARYPLIDNLSPLSAGTKYRMAERSTLTKARDLTSLIKFNLLETSTRQKVAVLGERNETGPPHWDVERARGLGSSLFAGALADDDPLLPLLSSAGEHDELAGALRSLAQDRSELSDEEVLALCDQLAARQADSQCPTIAPATLGSLVEKLVSSRTRTVGPYVEERWEELPDMRVFVYGHTHAFETEWPVEISSRVTVHVLNDGAFQRVVDDAKFRELAQEAGKSPAQALQELDLAELPACYTFVEISSSEGTPLHRELSAWHMDEAGPGEIVDVCDPRCADVGHGCSE